MSAQLRCSLQIRDGRGLIRKCCLLRFDLSEQTGTLLLLAFSKLIMLDKLLL